VSLPESDLVRVPPGRADRYRESGWWLPERVDELVLRHAAGAPDRCAAVAYDRRLTYGELAAAVGHAAVRLRALGVARGDAVLVQLPNDLELLVLVLALVRLGAPPVLTLPALREHELSHVLETVRPAAIAVPRRWRHFDHLALARRLMAEHPDVRHLLVTGADGPDQVELRELCAPPGQPAPDDLDGPDPSDVALFLLSSGTTGPPKAIARTHEDYGCAIRSASAVSGLSRESVYLALMPATHSFVFGHPGMLGALAGGGRVVLDAVDDPARAFQLIERERVTHCALVPALVTQWLGAARGRAHDLTSLRVLQVGGAKLGAAAAAEAAAVLGCGVQQVYGMSEGLLNFTRLDDPDEVWIETQGRPASPGDELRIVDAAGSPVPAGETGELLTRGPYTVAGYYRDPETNAGSFTSDGFYRTGDLVRLHPSGNLVVAGRVKDVINRGGEKIASEELEAVVLQHPAVRAAAVVAMPHPLYGEAVALFAVPDEGAALDLRGVRRFLEGRGLARYKLPERLEVVDALPLVGVGKIDKKALRRLLS
jgi:2,3-dihydroxybenzoate-AMP ligase